MGRLDGKIGIITGAASGLGAAAARLLAREGATLIVTDIAEEAGQALVASFRADGADARFVRHDVAEQGDWEAVCRVASADLGGLDFLVNNAGIGVPSGNIEKQGIGDWRRIMRVNGEGVFLGIKHAIELMKPRGGGSIVNVSSVVGIIGSATTASYVASKGAVRMLTKSAALHCAESGYRIRVNSIHPGYIATPLLDQSFRNKGDAGATFRQNLLDRIPLGEFGDPDDIGWGIVYLVSDESRYMTGAELVIDGGVVAQ